jgi:hypothetical protein
VLHQLIRTSYAPPGFLTLPAARRVLDRFCSERDLFFRASITLQATAIE